MSLTGGAGTRKKTNKKALTVKENMVYSRDHELSGVFYEAADSREYNSGTLTCQYNKGHLQLIRFLDAIKLVELASYKNHQALAGRQTKDNLYLLSMSSDWVSSPYLCRQLVSAADRMKSVHAKLVVVVSELPLSDPRLLGNFYHNLCELSDEGVELGMEYQTYINGGALPARVLETLNYIFLNPFSIGMPSNNTEINYSNLTHAADVVREIHNQLDVKLVATRIETEWQERVVRALPIHYFLGGFYGIYEETVHASQW